MGDYSRYERELIDRIEDEGWIAMRAPASGGATDRDLPDVIAAREHPLWGRGVSEAYLLEVKYSSTTPLYVDEEDCRQVEDFAEAFGGKPRIAIRWNGGKKPFVGDTDFYLVPPSRGEQKEANRRFDYEDVKDERRL